MTDKPAKFVHILRWTEGKHEQMYIFDDIEAARDMADYIRAARYVGSSLTTESVYGRNFVAQVKRDRKAAPMVATCTMTDAPCTLNCGLACSLQMDALTTTPHTKEPT
jgi:hypothetical protein